MHRASHPGDMLEARPREGLREGSRRPLAGAAGTLWRGAGAGGKGGGGEGKFSRLEGIVTTTMHV